MKEYFNSPDKKFDAPKWETTQMSINVEKIDKLWYSGVLLNNKKLLGNPTT